MRGEKEEEVCEGEAAREPHLPEGVTETPCGLPWLEFCLQRAAAASTFPQLGAHPGSQTVSSGEAAAVVR